MQRRIQANQLESIKPVLKILARYL